MANINKIKLSGTSYDIQDSNAARSITLTQAQYDALVDKDPNVFYIISDSNVGYVTSAETESAITQAVSGKADSSDVYTKSETSGATEIATALSGKQDTLSAGTNITIVDNVISAEGGGGGKAISAGTNISITTGETADTINCTLPITADTKHNYHFIHSYNTSGNENVTFGTNNSINANGSFIVGGSNYVYGNGSFIHGHSCKANKLRNHLVGDYLLSINSNESSFGKYNSTTSASTTFGDSGNTLFSVGNGTADNARHNAFEIRQDGSIFITSGGTDIKLQDHLGGGGGGGSSYTAGDGIDITNNVISVTGKQDTLSAGTNITIVDNVISATGGGGGGKAISGGTNISVTTGETADTINCTLPITADTDGSFAKFVVGSNNTIGSDTEQNIIIGDSNGTFGQGSGRYYTGATIIGYNNSVGCIGKQNDNNDWSTAIGKRNKINGGNSYVIGVDNNFYDDMIKKKNYCFVFGRSNSGYTLTSDISNAFVFGAYNNITKSDEFALGEYNASSNDGTTSGNTFFSIGNGTSNNARHNAFEIRQNGDIYLTSGGTDIKLQDHLGGGGGGITSGEVQTMIDESISGKQDTLSAGTNITIVDNVISATGGGGGGGLTEDDELLLSTALTDLNDRKIDASEVRSNYQRKGDYATKSYVTTALEPYETKLDEINTEEVTAYALNDLNDRFGGLRLVKITESEYAALTTKDENTLYVVVADPT